MRKDVKIIMGVCVVVLVGLIVYALFLPGEKKGETTTENSADNTTAVNTETPTTEPSVAEESTTQPSENAVAISPATMPSETAMANAPSPVAAAPAAGDWNKLLNTGTSAPDNGAGSNGSSVNTPAPMPTLSNSSSAMTESSVANTGGDSTPGRTAMEASKTGTREYIVKAGDTPTSIAQAEYGNGHLYTKILAANPKLNARHMRVGQKIVLPDLSGTANASGTVVGSSAAASPSSGLTPLESSETSTTATPTAGHYTVASGDSLQRISVKLYGNSSQWEKIYALNKSKIGSNPARLRVGMVLNLPKARTSPSETTAVPSRAPEMTVSPAAGNSAIR